MRRAGWILLLVVACTPEVREPLPTAVLPSPPVPPELGEEWDHCPGEEGWRGDETWSDTLRTGTVSVFCSTANPGVPLEDLLGHPSTELRVVPGQWPIPYVTEEVPLALPFCSVVGDDAGPSTGDGSVTAMAWLDEDGPNFDRRLAATFPFGEGVLEFRLTYDSTISGLFVNGTEASGHVDLWSVGRPIDETFMGCSRVGNECDSLVFVGAAIQLDQVVDTGPGGRQRIRIVRARGDYGGISFDIDGGSELVVSYGDVLAGRDAYIWFYGPIGDACGLELREYTRDADAREIWAVDCAGERLEELEVQTETHDRVAGCSAEP